MSLESRVKLEVDLGKLSENFLEIRRRVAPARVAAVLKANAYGLGVLPVAETVRAAGAAMFGVAEINEAIELVPLGLPVQILGNLLPDEIAPAVEYGLICPLNDLEMARRISAEAVRQNRVVRGAVTVDSGMGGSGCRSRRPLRKSLRCAVFPIWNCTRFIRIFRPPICVTTITVCSSWPASRRFWLNWPAPG